MKITKTKLKQIIKKELNSALNERGGFSLRRAAEMQWVLTTGQAMAAQAAGLQPGIDLKGILLNATQGHHPASIELLNHPAFQEDPRVKEHGY